VREHSRGGDGVEQERERSEEEVKCEKGFSARPRTAFIGGENW
jgi:hypothetical protein